MPQNTEVMALRKRLKHHGYTEVKILQATTDKGDKLPGKYDISAVEPLSKTTVQTRLSVGAMGYMFK